MSKAGSIASAGSRPARAGAEDSGTAPRRRRPPVAEIHDRLRERICLLRCPPGTLLV